MIDAELLKLVVCPENHTRLTVAEPELLDRLNRAIAAKRVRTRGGQEVVTPLESGLIRVDRTVLYPVVDGIPTLLTDEAIPLDQVEA